MSTDDSLYIASCAASLDERMRRTVAWLPFYRVYGWWPHADEARRLELLRQLPQRSVSPAGFAP